MPRRRREQCRSQSTNPWNENRKTTERGNEIIKNRKTTERGNEIKSSFFGKKKNVEVNSSTLALMVFVRKPLEDEL